jgi:hypothetical protein
MCKLSNIAAAVKIRAKPTRLARGIPDGPTMANWRAIKLKDKAGNGFHDD